jgi:trigger factor
LSIKLEFWLKENGFPEAFFIIEYPTYVNLGVGWMAEEEKTQEEKTTEEEKTKSQTDKNIVKIEESGPCKKKVSVEIPEETIKASLDEQYEELRHEAVVPGFRKGRAPLRLLEKRFGTNVRTQVKLKLLAEASEAALKDNELDSLGEPDVDHEKVELPDTGPMKFEFEVEVRPEFKLPELEGIEVEKTKIETTDQQLDDDILAMRKRAGIWTPKEDGKVEIDDQVVADAVLIIEGAAEHEKHDNIELFARKNGFVGAVPVENLDQLLKGAKQGDEKKTSVEVPSTFFNEQYRGKKVDIEITVKEIKQLEPAELNEEFFSRFGVDNVDDLRDRISESRSAQAEQQARTAMNEQVYKYLLDKTKLDLPADIVADQSTRILQRQYTNMLMQGIERDQIDQQMEALRASSEQQAKEQMKLFFIMDKIAEQFEVSVTEEEINGHIAQVAASRGRRPEKMREELARDGSLAQFSLQIREQKCIERILEKAKIKEVQPAKAKKKTAKKASKKIAEKAKAEPKKTTKKAEKKTAKKAASRESVSAKRTKKTSTKKAPKKEK